MLYLTLISYISKKIKLDDDEEGNVKVNKGGEKKEEKPKL